MKKIKGYITGNDGCSYYRCILPFSKLDSTKWNAKTKTVMEPEDFDDLDIMVLNRADSFDVYQNTFIALKKGIKVVYELDDLLHDVPKYNPAYDYYEHPFIKPNVESFIQTSDLVTVSTEPLKEFYSKWNSNIHVLPNSLDFNHWSQFKKVNSDNIIIGWAGSPTHKDDIKIIIPSLIKILKNNPNVKLKAVGYNFFLDNPEFKEVGSQIIFTKHLDVYNFPKLLTNIDIAIAPLEFNHFNECKSNVKFLEYSALSIPSVLTDIEPYSKTTGIKIRDNNLNDWENALQELINDESLRETIGKNSFNYVYENFNLDVNSKMWDLTYSMV